MNQHKNDPDRLLRYLAAIAATISIMAAAAWIPSVNFEDPLLLSGWNIPNGQDLSYAIWLILPLTFCACVLLRRTEARSIAMVAIGWQLLIPNVLSIWVISEKFAGGSFAIFVLVELISRLWQCYVIAVACLLIARKKSAPWYLLGLCIGSIFLFFMFSSTDSGFGPITAGGQSEFAYPLLSERMFNYMAIVVMFVPDAWIPRSEWLTNALLKIRPPNPLGAETAEAGPKKSDPDRRLRYVAAIVTSLPVVAYAGYYTLDVFQYFYYIETLPSLLNLIVPFALYLLILMRLSKARYIGMVAVGWPLLLDNLEQIWEWTRPSTYEFPLTAKMVHFMVLTQCAWCGIVVIIALLLITRLNVGRWCYLSLVIFTILIVNPIAARNQRIESHIARAVVSDSGGTPGQSSGTPIQAPEEPGAATIELWAFGHFFRRLFTYMALAAMFFPDTWIPRSTRLREAVFRITERQFTTA